MEGKLASWLPKLPLASQAVLEVRETAAEFAIRRLWCVVAHYRESDSIPTQAELAKRAGLQRQLENEDVLTTFAEATAQLGCGSAKSALTSRYNAA